MCGKTRGVAVAVSYRYLAPSPLLTLAASRMRRRTGDKKYITPRHGCKLRASGKEGREKSLLRFPTFPNWRKFRATGEKLRVCFRERFCILGRENLRGPRFLRSSLLFLCFFLPCVSSLLVSYRASDTRLIGGKKGVLHFNSKEQLSMRRAKNKAFSFIHLSDFVFQKDVRNCSLSCLFFARETCDEEDSPILALPSLFCMGPPARPADGRPVFSFCCCGLAAWGKKEERSQHNLARGKFPPNFPRKRRTKALALSFCVLL